MWRRGWKRRKRRSSALSVVLDSCLPVLGRKGWQTIEKVEVFRYLGRLFQGRKCAWGGYGMDERTMAEVERVHLRLLDCKYTHQSIKGSTEKWSRPAPPPPPPLYVNECWALDKVQEGPVRKKDTGVGVLVGPVLMQLKMKEPRLKWYRHTQKARRLALVFDATRRWPRGAPKKSWRDGFKGDLA